MAINFQFHCSENNEDFLTVTNDTEEVILGGSFGGEKIEYYLDITTAIKLSKTIRTHINLVKGI